MADLMDGLQHITETVNSNQPYLSVIAFTCPVFLT